MYLYSHGCGTTYFVPDYSSSSDHHLTSCYEKWAQSGTKNWIYNRWALFTQAPGDIISTPRTTDFAIRSRPWQGNESTVSSTGAWIPTVGGTSCTSIADLKLAIGSAEITVPIHQCDHLTVLPDAAKHSMGLDWSGATTDQRYLDWALDVYAPNTSVIPVYADYSWAEVDYCSLSLSCDYHQYLLNKDAGWYWP